MSYANDCEKSSEDKSRWHTRYVVPYIHLAEIFLEGRHLGVVLAVLGEQTKRLDFFCKLGGLSGAFLVEGDGRVGGLTSAIRPKSLERDCKTLQWNRRLEGFKDGKCGRDYQ